MKKTVLTTLALIGILMPACTNQPASNNNTDSGKLPFSSPGPGTPTPPPPSPAPNNITIIYRVSKTAADGVVVMEDCPDCTTPVPTVNVAAGAAHIVKWRVEFDPGFVSSNPKVSIEKFKTVTVAATSGLTYAAADPFPTSPVKPPFTFDTTPGGGADKQSVPGPKGVYKYSVVVTWTESGNPNKVTLDPRVVFDE